MDEPQDLNELWAMDFMADQLADGRRFRLLVVMDVFNRECLALEADTSISGERVSRVLDRVIFERGKPQCLGSDNGPEFRGRAMDLWAFRRKIKLHFIKPGTPTQNAYVESLNAQIRKQLLNVNWFTSLADVRVKAEKWRQDYNTINRHGSLGKMTPVDYAIAHGHRPSATPTTAGHELHEKNTMRVGLT